MAKLEMWKQKIIAEESVMSNEELLNAVLSQANGDDYDGCFTERGAWEYDYLKLRLRNRLVNWLNQCVAEAQS